MKGREQHFGKFLYQSFARFHTLPPAPVEPAWERVMGRLEEEPEGASDNTQAAIDSIRPLTPLLPRWLTWATAAVICTVALFLVFRQGSSPALVEAGDVYRVVKGETQFLRVGENLRMAESIHSHGSGSTLLLKDGTRVEMRGGSELSLEPADGSVRIRLYQGGIIVTAAKQAPGRHLDVATSDTLVSVVGTVFFVSIAEEGTRVGVIEGEVRVQQRGVERRLKPGAQVSTNASVKPRPVEEEIAWSRNAAQYVALLPQSSSTVQAPVPPPVSVEPHAPTIVQEQRLEFELASVKRNTNDGRTDSRPRRSGNLVMMHNTQLFTMIFYAYELTASYQIEGYVDFVDPWRWYDVDAVAPDGATDEQIRKMFQTLLADRFKLKVHTQVKETFQGYELSINGKSKLQPPTDGQMRVIVKEAPEKPLVTAPGLCFVSLWRDGSHLTCHAVTMDRLVLELSRALRSPVVDRTGLTETYDVHIRYLSDDRLLDPDVEPGPTLPQALQEELGLKLERKKTPVNMLVIDHMEKPSEN